jgi:hypothetical protein
MHVGKDEGRGQRGKGTEEVVEVNFSQVDYRDSTTASVPLDICTSEKEAR